MRTVAAVVALVACVQAGLWALARTDLSAPDFEGQLASVSYAPFAGNVNADQGGQARAEQIRSDLALLTPLTRSIRLYSSTGGVELVPPIADEFGLRVTVGAWIDKDRERNAREIKSAIELARRNSNVKSVIVGNETVYRDDIKVPDLIRLIQKVKRSVSVPVSTGEIWSVWRDHPELVSAVDYIAVHILPYWEGVSAQSAVEAAIGGYQNLRRLSRQAHRDRRVRLAERRL
jgi:exo-beta-1,3-glucanase (GH17 family)